MQEENALRTEAGGRAWRGPARRIYGFVGWAALISLFFLLPLTALGKLAMKEELHSHILLIPAISIYLAVTNRERLPLATHRSPAVAAVFAVAAATVYGASWLTDRAMSWSAVDRLACAIASYVLFVVAGGFATLGMSWMRKLAFPFAFLIFMIPMPDGLVVGLEEFLMRLSADLSAMLFRMTDTPVFRRGQILELPGITLEVARECSGIRSSLVLFITSLLASYMFLKSAAHRALLVALVIPLGILRNAIRVVTIGLLCVHFGPQMIDSWIHRRGGPVFFGISLIPLFVAAAWFRYRENQWRHEGDFSAGVITGGKEAAEKRPEIVAETTD